jgi:hypothetical protein
VWGVLNHGVFCVNKGGCMQPTTGLELNGVCFVFVDFVCAATLIVLSLCIEVQFFRVCNKKCK